MADKRKSRTQRWSEAVVAAQSAVSDLRAAMEKLNDLCFEFNEWKDALPDNLQDGSVGQKLQAIEDMDVDEAMRSLDTLEEFINESEAADLPRGFGRD